MQLFTTSYLNDYKVLRNAVIGFEFEMYSKLNYPMTLEYLNRALPNTKVLGFKQYHSDFKPDENTFKLEPDLSGGFNMAELVTGPIPYTNARLVLVQVLKVMQEIAYTTDRSGIHINISFNEESGKRIEQLNVLKTILNLDEEKVYVGFPDRENNIYAKSIKSIIPFRDYDYSNSTANVLSNSLLLPSSKYYGVNFNALDNGRLEFRYIGGEDYEYKVDSILEMMDYFILTTWNALGTPLDADESRKLRHYLDTNIGRYKSLNDLESFMSEFPNVSLQVDKKDTFEVVNSYYSEMFNTVFDLVQNTRGLDECIINYDTDSKSVEVVGGKLDCKGLVSNMKIIECEVVNGDFLNCELIGCKVEKSILNASKLRDSHATESKLMETSVDSECELEECFFSEGLMDGLMSGGVFRSGKVGTNGVLSPETKVFNTKDNFFNFKINPSSHAGHDKKALKFKGK
jgi:hypothetical protein